MFDALEAAGVRVLAFVDDGARPDAEFCGRMVRRTLGEIGVPALGVALGVGDNAARARIAASVRAEGHELVACVHPTAVLSRHSVLEQGAFVGALAVVNPFAHVGEGAIVNTGAIVEHDVRIGPFAHVCPRAVVGGGGAVGEGALLGTGAIVLPLAKVGARAKVGAGAVVLREVADDTVAVGVPARPRGRPV